MWCVVLQTKGTTRNALITPHHAAVPTGEMLGAILRRIAAPEFIGTWKWNGHIVYLFAYKSGKAGSENKHELPPPLDKNLLFGDAVVFAMKGGTVVSFGTNEFEKFYNEAFGGFEDLGSEDSEDDEDEDEEVEEEEEVVVEEDAADADAPVDAADAADADDDADEVVAPIKAIKVKRGAKKLQNFYTFEELTPEAYSLIRTCAGAGAGAGAETVAR